eukprot:TRINITY_DN16752_c0_g1_i2.p1 TRINITY_DN16752_c0_g1~~TRINITY_DN16752_c0_g1_i2.p1  ORF type:complete len:886 (+),score=149.62 TRINITY_DN16752_c0_g1_i2:65-2722(+)
MDSLLWAVGLSSESATKSSWKSASSKSSKRRPQSVGVGVGPAKAEEIGLPDLASIARATEQGILVLEEEARGMEAASLSQALELLQRWSQALRRRPRPEDSLASFKAQFLRSNALEKTLEALHKNEQLRTELFDRPLFASSDGSSSAEALMAELRAILQLCLPRAAAQVAVPLLQVVLAEQTVPTETLSAAVTALRALKEDWREVVRSQAVRSLERKLDSLAYELQKTPGSPALSSARRASHDHVAVLATVCEAIAESHAGTEAHSADIESALVSIGLKSPGAASSSSSRVLGGAAPSSTAEPASDIRSRASSAMSYCLTDAEGIGTGNGTNENLPSSSDCEAAVAAMLNKTEGGMQEGLLLLGLPSSPLQFVPGVELVLCGHDIRSSVSDLLAHWLEGEKVIFFEALIVLRQLVQTAKGESRQSDLSMAEDLAELMTLRASLVQERRTLAERIARIDRRLIDVDAQMAAFPGHRQCKERNDASGLEETVSESGLLGLHSTPPASAAMSVTSVDRRPPPALSPELASTVSSVAEALVGETQRSLERLATQQQQRRTQLLAVLTSHLEGEEARLSALSVAPSGYRGAEAVASEQLGEALQEAQQLCEKVQVALEGPGRRNVGLSDFSAGSRCRARWMDGTFYDATIHSVQNDGTVVVNWLRPRPSTTSDGTEPPQRTVSEHGGDDTLHRIVSKADVQIDGVSPGGHSDTQAALTFFLHRPIEDRSCADCSTKNTEWASVSFGTYLCVRCASEHESMGPRRSLVRPLNDGWGWTRSDLKYMRVGGNVAFQNCLKMYPSVQRLPVLERPLPRPRMRSCISRMPRWWLPPSASLRDTPRASQRRSAQSHLGAVRMQRATCRRGQRRFHANAWAKEFCQQRSNSTAADVE